MFYGNAAGEIENHMEKDCIALILRPSLYNKVTPNGRKNCFMMFLCDRT